MPRLRGPAPGRVPRLLTAGIVVVLAGGLAGAAGVGIDGRDSTAPARPGDNKATGAEAPQADEVVLQADDFPSGWEPSEREDAGGGAGTDGGAGGKGGATAEFCPALEGDPTEGRLASEAESFFTNDGPGEFAFAGSFVGVVDDASVAPAGFTFLTDERFLRCTADGFAKGFLETAEGVTLTEVSSEPLTPTVGSGQAQGRRLTFTARGPNFEVPLHVDLTVIQAGASVGVAFLGAYHQPLAPALERRLLDSLLGRMAETG